MASFAKATKWLLAGDKVKGKSWDKGYWWRKLGTDIIDQDGDIVELNSVDLAATDWVRLVPRKRVAALEAALRKAQVALADNALSQEHGGNGISPEYFASVRATISKALEAK